MAAGKAVAQSADAAELRPVHTFRDYALARVEEDKAKAVERANALGDAQMDAILSADSLEAMFSADDMDSTGGRDLEEVEMCILDVAYAASDRFTHGLSLGSGLYLYVFITSQRLDTREIIVWNTGSRLIIGKIRWLEANELFGTPDANVVIKGADTQSGGRVLKLYGVPKRSVQGEVDS